VISASLLEERYGLRVNLIGVTAAGDLMVIIYPNRGSTISPGSTVAVPFGDTQLEPITAK
jgi:hypothetical protein